MATALKIRTYFLSFSFPNSLNFILIVPTRLVRPPQNFQHVIQYSRFNPSSLLLSVARGRWIVPCLLLRRR